MSFPKLFPQWSPLQNLTIYALAFTIAFLSMGILHKLQMRGAEQAYAKGCNPTVLNQSQWIECMKN